MELSEVLVRQAGVVSLAQARACGLSDDTVRRRVASGAWEPVHPRVFRVAGHPWSDRARLWAASLWAGERGVVSGPAAAYVHRLLTRAPSQIEVTVPRGNRRRAPAGIVVRRRDLGPEDSGSRGGIRVTTLALTILETTLVEGPAFLDRGLQKHVQLPDVIAAYERNRGAHGWPRLGPLLVAARDRTASSMERLFLALLRRAEITGWVVNLEIGSWKADVAFPEPRVAIELDSWAWHVEQDRFQNDRTKGNTLALAGWTVLRFTWADVTQRPEQTLAVLRRALRRAA